MATRAKAEQNLDRYLDLIRRFPLRPLRSDKELDQAIAVMDSLLDLKLLEPEEKDYLDVLSDQVERYERDNHPVPRVSDAEVLQHLIEARGVTQAEVARATGIAPSTISSLLSGKRSPSRGHIAKLSGYFHVEPGVFNFKA